MNSVGKHRRCLSSSLARSARPTREPQAGTPLGAARAACQPAHLYLQLPQELGDLSAAQLLTGLLVGTDHLLHGHVLGCRHKDQCGTPQPGPLGALAPTLTTLCLLPAYCCPRHQSQSRLSRQHTLVPWTWVCKCHNSPRLSSCIPAGLGLSGSRPCPQQHHGQHRGPPRHGSPGTGSKRHSWPVSAHPVTRASEGGRCPGAETEPSL